MKIRLSEISDIPYPENLYVLMESLEGFKQIFKAGGVFNSAVGAIQFSLCDLAVKT